MCLIHETVFKLKRGFTGPHRVEISFHGNGNYARVSVEDSQRQRIEMFPCAGQEEECSKCAERPGENLDFQDEMSVRMIKFGEIFVDQYKEAKKGAMRA